MSKQKTQQALALRAEAQMEALIQGASTRLHGAEGADSALLAEIDDETAALATSDAL